MGEKEAAQRRAEGQSRREAGGGGATTSAIPGPPPIAGQVDHARMRTEFGKDAEDVFMFGHKGHFGGKRVYFKKGDKNAYTY